MHCVVSPGTTSLSLIGAENQLQKTLREQFIEVESGRPATRSDDHIAHCFDALRQYVMCTADDTLLQSFGLGKIGVGQVRQCKNWDQLREFATRHTSGYDDNEQRHGISRFGHDDHGKDGLPVGGLV